MNRERLPGPPLALARADRQARSLRAGLDRVALVLARAAAGFVRRRAWLDFGYARLEDHARERFSRSGRWMRDLAALAKAVEALPGLADALAGADGERPLGRVAALLIGRIADPPSLASWVDLARRSTVRELRRAVRSARAEGSTFPPGCATDAARDETGDEPDEARTQVRLPVPSAVRSAFDETLDLYRALVGRDASATSFVEDLVAEAASGPHPPDADERSLHRVAPVAAVEQALARSTANWRHLDDDALAELPGFGMPTSRKGGTLSTALAPSSDSPDSPHSPDTPGNPDDLHDPGGLDGSVARGSVSSLLRRLEKISLQTDCETATGLDAGIRDLLGIEESLERRLGSLLNRMGEAGAWLRLHFAGVGHYAEERLGLSRTQAQNRARVARRLRERPLLRAAYDSGALGIEAASLLLRLPLGHAAPDCDAAWITRAGEVTVKRLRDECRAVRRASLCAATPPGPLAPLLPIRPPRSSPAGRDDRPALAPLADETWFASLRRDRGTARRRLAELGRLALASRVSNDMLCLRLPAWLAESFLSTLESARRAAELSSESTFESTRLLSTRGRPTPAWVGLLALLDEFVNTWDPPSSGRRPSEEEVYARDGWRCTAPGCTSRRNLEDHHLLYRSHGGGNDHANRICLCRFHHQWGEHGTLATCRGEAPLGVLWSLGRHSVGGRFRNERAVPVRPPLSAGLGPGRAERAL